MNRDASPERLGKCVECNGWRKQGELFICMECRKKFDPCGKCWTTHSEDVECPHKRTVKAHFVDMLKDRAEELGFEVDYYFKVLRRDLSILEKNDI